MSEAPSLPSASNEQAYKHVSALEAGQLSVPWDSIAAGGQLDEPMALPLACILPASLEARHRNSQRLENLRLLQQSNSCLTQHRRWQNLRGVTPSSIDFIILSHFHAF
jgi:hypothetical protein